MLPEVEVPEPIVQEDALLSVFVVDGVISKGLPDSGVLPPSISSFAPSPSLNVFTNIFHVSGMDWMGEKLKNLVISQLPNVATTPSSTAFLEDVPPLPLVPDVDGVGSPIQHTPSDSWFFLRPGKKIHFWGLRKGLTSCVPWEGM